MELLYLGLSILGDILGGIVSLDALLDEVVGVTAGITDTYLGVLCIGLDLLDELTATIFGEGRDTDADKLPVVLGCDAEGGVDDSTLNLLDDALLPGGDDDALGIGDRDCAYLC